jgi:DNA-binding winged helix-turn-helix (wHTH) protein/cytochrome c-type biogenesis protein CcmH/NrfG
MKNVHARPRLGPRITAMPADGDFVFGPYQLDTRLKQLVRDGAPVDLSPRQFDILHALVSRAGDILSKDALIIVGWRDVAVSDSSVEKIVFHLRQRLDADHPDRYIATVARRGYRFAAPVTRVDRRRADEDLAALLAPHRAWTEGRAALETLERDRIADARSTFERLIAHHSGQAVFHVGLANACAMQFEATRTDARPDTEALRHAAVHARTACHLNPDLAEAWATLGFVLERTGERDDALAALGRAVMLEPDNWRHQFRLAAGSWGEDRLRAARRALSACPHLPMAHWLAASVSVARDALDRAEREVDAGLAILAVESTEPARFSTVAFHWLKGLLCLARGDAGEAMAAFDRELALEARDHLYARECAANTWYAKGACQLEGGDREAARAAFREAIARVPRHPMAHAGLAILDGVPLVARASGDDDAPLPVDLAFARAARLVSAGDTSAAAAIAGVALAAAPPGNAGWLLPIEPLIGVRHAREAWTPVLAALHLRAR